MKLSRPVDYALRACVDMALQEDYLTDVGSIARRQGMSSAYLAKIVRRLARAGIVVTSRGVNGGVRLVVNPDKLTVLQVMEAVDGPVVFSKCQLWPGECPARDSCPYHAMLTGLTESIRNYLGSVTIAQLRQRAALLPSPEVHSARR